MISSQPTSSSEHTSPLRTLRNEDSRAATTPVGQRAFNGELPSETSGKRVRPDATTRGIGPDANTQDRTQPTMQVRSSEVECLSEVNGTGELQIPWMRNDFRFVLFVGGGAFMLVLSMLMVMSRGSVESAPSDGKVMVTSASAADPSAALNQTAPKAELAAPAQESEPFEKPEVVPLVHEEEQAAKADAPVKKARATARAGKTRVGVKAKVGANGKIGTRTTKAKKPVRKTRARL